MKVRLGDVLCECKRRGIRFSDNGRDEYKKMVEQARSCAIKADLEIKNVLKGSNVTTLKKLLSKISPLGGVRREVDALFYKAKERVGSAAHDFNELAHELDRHIKNDLD